MTTIAETPRLVVRRFTPDDAAFFLELLNDPGWIANIGDRGVRTVEAARDYIRDKMLAAYERMGFGMYVVELKDGTPIGTAGLVKRPALDDADLGFAFLPAWRGAGYAREAAAAMLSHAWNDFALERMLAIVAPHNAPSVRLLEALGFGFERRVTLPNDTEELLLYALAAP
jgi:RimJ/RimL family protein N-acetyltransferase